MTTTPRRMRPEDATAVARIYASRLRSGRAVDLSVVARRLHRAYFEHPWVDPELGPLVCEGSSGRIIGFLGVVPRPMRWRGEHLRAVHIGNLVVDAEHAEVGASDAIIRAFLAGPQDLAISDHALDVTRRISERYGGATIRVWSPSWELALQPAIIAVNRRLGRRSARAARVVAPVARAIDALGRRFERGPWWIERNDCQTRPLPLDRLAELVDRYGGESIKPVYDARALAWVLDTPRGREPGLRVREVLNARGHTLGCFVHYVEEDSELLHLGAELGAGARVFDCLVADAIEAGARKLTGRVIPSLMLEMSTKGVRFQTESWLILNTRRRDIVAAFHAGDVSFNPMDGERWSMRFVDVDDLRPA